jgi:hypothetical protein
MTLRDRQQKIQWFLDLISIKNMVKLDKDERAELACMIEKHVHDSYDYGPKGYDVMRLEIMKQLKTTIDPSRLEKFREKIANFWGFMVSSIDRVKKITIQDWGSAEEIDFMPHLNRDQIELPYDLSVSGIGYDTKVNDGEKVYKPKPKALSNARIKVSYEGLLVTEELLLYSFARLLDGAPITAFKECPGCGKWFVNLTKRQRIYCGNQCAAKMGKRRERKISQKKIKLGDSKEIEKRQIELQKNRERAKAWYERKIRSKHPNAIVNSR